MNKEEFELSINMSDEEIERIKNILCAGRGVRHYLLKIHNDEELDVVEYKEYQKLEQQNKELHNKIDKAIRYIKKNKHYIDIEDMNMYLYESDINKVLEILKDSDVDDRYTSN